MKINIQKVIYAGALILLLLLQGCKNQYETYKRPAVWTPTTIHRGADMSDTVTVNDTTSFGNLRWKEVFTDPLLQKHIAFALKQNFDLLNAALNINMAEQQLKAAKLAFLPSFQFTPQGTIASWDGSQPIKTYSMPVAASWNVDLFGNLLSQKRSAQVALIASKDYKLAVQTSLIAGLANTYYTLLMLDKQWQILEDMEQLTHDTWEKMKLLKELSRGVRSTGVQTAEANYYAVQVQKQALQKQITETENAFCLLLGVPGQKVQRNRLEDQSFPEQYAAGVSLQQLGNRPDVHAAEMSLAQCFYGIQTARSRFYPNINIALTGAFTNNSGMGIVSPAKLMLTAVGALVQPIFQKGQLIAGLKVSQAKYQQAYNNWQKSIFKAANEVSNALVLYHTSQQKSDIEAKQIKVLEQNVIDTKELLAGSNSTYLEVITAQQALLNAKLNKVKDDFSKIQAVVNLYSALGGGVR